MAATSSGGFTGAVGLTCTIAPTAASDPATCAFSPSSATITGAATQTSTLSVTTTAATTASLDHRNSGNAPWYTAGGLSLACLVLVIVPTRRRHLRMMLGIIILSGLTELGIVSCGGGGGSKNNGGGGGTSNPGTTAGTYTVTVTGTAGSTTQTTTVTLTVN